MFRISDEIRSTRTQDGSILLNVHQGDIFCVNVVGAKILELLREGYDESHIADEISQQCGVSREVVHRDLLNFIETLHKHRILQPIPSAEAI